LKTEVKDGMHGFNRQVEIMEPYLAFRRGNPELRNIPGVIDAQLLFVPPSSVERISHVINYTLPNNPENYVHRIGRTGRAGATGTSVSFACEEDSFRIPAIEKFIGHELHCTQPDKDWLTLPPPDKKYKPKKRRPRRRKQADPG
jgi:hypothetical protein